MKKVNYRNLTSHLSLLLLACLLTFSTTIFAQDVSTIAENGAGDPAAGEALFKANCAACHKLDKKATGPALRNVANKYDKEWLYEWIKNSQGLIKSGDALAVKLFAENNNAVMTSFPALSDGDITNILAYTSQPKPEPIAAVTTAADTAGGGDITNNIILGALALIFLLLVVMLYLVSKTLKRIAVASGVEIEKPRDLAWFHFAVFHIKG